MDSLRLRSPAKVNLRLDVLYKRNDGYHEIRSVMQEIDLCDEVTISLGGSKLKVSCDDRETPEGTENLAHRAARNILRRFKIDVGIDIFIEKRIPVASGLGGGSSNAAATLMGLNKLLRLRLTKKELMEMGTQLGADVPFFIFGRRALVTGIGDRLRKIELPSPLWTVLVNPNIRVSTAWAYKNLNMGLTKKKNNCTLSSRNGQC